MSSPVLVSLPRRRTPPVPGPWQDAPTVIASVTWLQTGADARTVVHADRLASWRVQLAKARGSKMTPARAAKLRALGAKLCGCTLCDWALRPAATQEEHAARMEETTRRNAAGDWGACLFRSPLASAPAPCPDDAGWHGDAWGPGCAGVFGPRCKRCS